MISTPELPGLRFESVGKRLSPSPLRSDVAGFVGRTRRGPVGHPVRIEGLRDYQAVFGGLKRDKPLTYAIRGYFENGGQVAHVVRVIPDEHRCANAEWLIGEQDDQGHWNRNFPTAGFFRAAKYLVFATSPGRWAERLRVIVNYDLNGPGRTPTVSMTVECPGEVTEHLQRLVPGEAAPGKTMEELVAKQSKLIRIIPVDDSISRPTHNGGIAVVDENAAAHHAKVGKPAIDQSTTGPQRLTWELTLGLSGAVDLRVPPRENGSEEYRKAIVALADQSEVAIIATPSIYHDIPNKLMRNSILRSLIDEAVEKQDRLVLIDSPPYRADDSGSLNANELIAFVNELRNDHVSPISRRAASIYHPWLRVNDPLGDAARPLCTVPPSGHVAGVISRVDRERGAHYTPANVSILDAVDLETQYERGAGGTLNEAGVNLIRCIPGKGLMVWGGRTLDLSRDGRFVAHRRFIHRLIRAIRRVAEPVVFDINGPELWLILVRAVTTVLLEAFRGGALRGARPEEAFRVRCDERASSVTEREQGRVFCEIDLALVAPMEFITIRVSVSRDGKVEVFDL